MLGKARAPAVLHSLWKPNLYVYKRRNIYTRQITKKNPSFSLSLQDFFSLSEEGISNHTQNSATKKLS